MQLAATGQTVRVTLVTRSALLATPSMRIGVPAGTVPCGAAVTPVRENVDLFAPVTIANVAFELLLILAVSDPPAGEKRIP